MFIITMTITTVTKPLRLEPDKQTKRIMIVIVIIMMIIIINEEFMNVRIKEDKKETRKRNKA